MAGYNNMGMAQVFTIENTGTEQITELTASLGGTNFEISTPLSAQSVSVGESATISVMPKRGLAAGETPYMATLTITGSNGINLTVSLSFAVSAQANNVQYGNLKGYGEVDNTDLILMLRYFAGTVTGEDVIPAAADVNGDGAVNSADLTLLLRYLAQHGVVLGPPKGDDER
jgi:hypothetical protein